MTVSYALLFCVGPLMPEQPNERWYCVLFPVSNPRVGLQGGPRNPFGGVTTGVTSGVPQASKQARAEFGALSQGTFVTWRGQKG